MGELIQKIYRAGAKNAALLSALVILVSATRVLLFLLPLQLVVQILRRGSAGGRRNKTVSLRRRRRFSWAVRAVGKRLLPERPCLTQALVLQSLLRWHGDCSSKLCIGVDKDGGGGLTAHAWVEYDGEILIGGASSRKKFQELPNIENKIY